MPVLQKPVQYNGELLCNSNAGRPAQYVLLEIEDEM